MRPHSVCKSPKAVNSLAYGAACSDVAIDIGQIKGGFVQGVGWLTTEQLVWAGNGQLSTHAPSTYKIPTAGDVPEHFKVALWTEANREDTVFGSKAVGEPPLMLAISVYEALKEAVAAARPGVVDWMHRRPPRTY